MEGRLTTPFNLETEQAVLLSCFMTKESLYTALELCVEDDFYVPEHRSIFSAIKTLSRKAIPIDRTTIGSNIRETDKLVYDKLFENESVLSENIEEYCNILHEFTKLRVLLNVSYGVQKDVACYMPGDADVILDKASELLFKASQRVDDRAFVTPAELSDQVFSTIKSKRQTKDTRLLGLTTTLAKLDQITYGLENNNLIILAGRPSMGKTELALQIAGANASRGFPVGIFSIEQSDTELMERLIANITEIPLTRIKTGYLGAQEVDKLDRLQPLIAKLPIYIDSTPNISITHLVAKARRLKQRLPELALLIIDYLQLMNAPDMDNRVQEISVVSRSLKILAKSLNIPVLALSQLSRKCEDREDKHPILSDLRESGSIEQDADKVIFMYADYPYMKTSERQEVDKYKGEIIVTKHRNGPIDSMLITNNKPIQKICDREDLTPEQVGYVQDLETTSSEDDLPF